MNIRLILRMCITGTCIYQQPLIFVKLDFLQANELMGEALQFFCQRQQPAACIWQPKSETVQREQGKSIGHLKLNLLWIITSCKATLFIYLKTIGLCKSISWLTSSSAVSSAQARGAFECHSGLPISSIISRAFSATSRSLLKSSIWMASSKLTQRASSTSWS